MSSKSTHTKGPWEWNAGGIDSADLGIIAESGQMVAMVVVDEDYPQELPEQEANARLIAAAPDMLAALRMVVAGAGYTSGHVTPETLKRNGMGLNVPIIHLDQARASIARAEGGAA